MVCPSEGGYFAGSLAVMTDAAHLLVDFISFLISLLSLWLSSRPATHKLSYGWHRAGTTAASFCWRARGLRNAGSRGPQTTTGVIDEEPIQNFGAEGHCREFLCHL